MMQFFGIFCIRRYTGESAAGSSLYIKKKGKIYEKSKKSYCADFDRDVMHAAADGSADRGCRWGKTSGCIIYA